MSEVDQLKIEIEQLKNQLRKSGLHTMALHFTTGYYTNRFANLYEVLALRLRRIEDFVHYTSRYQGVPLNDELKEERASLVIKSERHHRPCLNCGEQPICKYSDGELDPDKYPVYIVKCPNGCKNEADMDILCDSPEEGFSMWDKFVEEKLKEEERLNGKF